MCVCATRRPSIGSTDTELSSLDSPQPLTRLVLDSARCRRAPSQVSARSRPRGRGGGRPRVAYPHTLHLTTHRALLPRSIHGETSIESQDRMYIPIENMTRLKPGHANTVKRILGWANVQRATARTEHARCVSCHGLLGYRSAAARRLSTRAYATDAADPLPTPRPFSAGRARYLSSFSDYVGEESSETEAQGQRRARRDPRSCSALTAVR